MKAPPSALVRDFGPLLAAARAGSKEALGSLLEQCRQILLRRSLQNVPPDLRPKCADSDLMQDTLLEAFRDFSKFRGNTLDELLAWLEHVRQNNFHNLSRAFRARRKRSIQLEVPLDDRCVASSLSASGPSPDKGVERREIADRIETALQSLPPLEQTVIRLRYWCGLGLDQIADKYGWTWSEVRTIQRRGIRRLHELIPPFNVSQHDPDHA